MHVKAIPSSASETAEGEAGLAAKGPLWAKAREKNPKVVMRITVQDETDEGGKPRVNVVVAF